jgi:hypothetical protein
MPRTGTKELASFAQQLSELTGYPFRISYQTGAPQLVVTTAGGGVDPVTVMGLTAGHLGDQLRSMIQGAKFALGDVPGGPTGWKRARRPRARSSRR